MYESHHRSATSGLTGPPGGRSQDLARTSGQGLGIIQLHSETDVVRSFILIPSGSYSPPVQSVYVWPTLLLATRLLA